MDVTGIHRLGARNLGTRGLWARLSIGDADPFALLRGEALPTGVRAAPLRTGPPVDVVGTGWAMLFLVSAQFREGMRGLNVTGWTSEAIELDAGLPPDLELLVVTGRCGRAYTAKADAGLRLPAFGTFVDPDRWDGSDLFVADGLGETLIAPSRVAELRRARLRNLLLEPAGLEPLPGSTSQ